MRGLLLLAPMFLMVACSAAPTIGVEESRSTSAKVTGSCSLSRDQIIASTSSDRAAAIQRGFAWLDANVPYSQSATNSDGYRTDCSGFVSMCWGLATPGVTTAEFASGGAGSSDLGSYDDLAPGDALVRRSGSSGHVMLFLGWNDDGHTEACTIEEASTALDMQFGVHTVSSLQGQSFQAIRNGSFSDSTPAAGTTTDPSATTTDDGTGQTTTTDPSTGTTTDPSTGDTYTANGDGTYTANGDGTYSPTDDGAGYYTSDDCADGYCGEDAECEYDEDCPDSMFCTVNGQCQ